MKGSKAVWEGYDDSGAKGSASKQDNLARQEFYLAKIASDAFLSLTSCIVPGSDGMGEEEWAIRIAEVEVSQGARSQAVEAYVSERQQAASKDQQPLNGGPNVALQALRLLDSTAQAE